MALRDEPISFWRNSVYFICFFPQKLFRQPRNTSRQISVFSDFTSRLLAASVGVVANMLIMQHC